MNDHDRQERWERCYRSLDESSLPEPAAVLADNTHLLPAHGTALDLACGRGGNALFLAAYGLQTQAWDYSSAAIERLQMLASEHGLHIDCAVRDVVAHPPATDSLDVIVVSRFLERDLAPHLMAALRPGGLLYYQTFVRDKVGTSGPTNPDFLLSPNELLVLFQDLRVCFYREDSRFGNLQQGLRDEAQFIGARHQPV